MGVRSLCFLFGTCFCSSRLKNEEKKINKRLHAAKCSKWCTVFFRGEVEVWVYSLRLFLLLKVKDCKKKKKKG